MQGALNQHGRHNQPLKGMCVEVACLASKLSPLCRARRKTITHFFFIGTLSITATIGYVGHRQYRYVSTLDTAPVDTVRIWIIFIINVTSQELVHWI